MSFRRSDRREFGRKVKEIAYAKARGHCQECTAMLVTGHFDYDHIVPWAISRDSSISNCEVLCDACHDLKTPKDIGVIAKSNRARARHIGAQEPSRHPLPGGRKSPFKLKVGGGVVDRRTGEPWRFGR